MLAVKKPKYVMLENVKGLLTDKMRKYFFQYLKDLDSFGYTSFYKVLDAKDYGVPQHRERIFVISILRTEDEPNPESTPPRESLLLSILLWVTEVTAFHYS